MKQEKVLAVIKEKIKIISTLAEQLNAQNDKESIIGFCSEVKSLRALLQMLSFHIDNNNLKLTDKVRDLYHIARDMRETISENDTLLIDKNSAMPDVQKAGKNLQTYKDLWAKVYNSKLFNKLEEKLVRIKYNEVPNVALANFFNVHKNEVNDFDGMTYNDPNISIKKHIIDILKDAENTDGHWSLSSRSLDLVSIKN